MSYQDFEDGTKNAYITSSDQVRSHDRFGYKIVAVVYSDRYWCAYRGGTAWTDEEVAQRGDMISENIATLLFPSLAFNRIYSD